jgi:hypothetical protein
MAADAIFLLARDAHALPLDVAAAAGLEVIAADHLLDLSLRA